MSALRVPVGLGFQGVLSNRRVSSFGPPLSTWQRRVVRSSAHIKEHHPLRALMAPQANSTAASRAEATADTPTWNTSPRDRVPFLRDMERRDHLFDLVHGLRSLFLNGMVHNRGKMVAESEEHILWSVNHPLDTFTWVRPSPTGGYTLAQATAGVTLPAAAPAASASAPSIGGTRRAPRRSCDCRTFYDPIPYYRDVSTRPLSILNQRRGPVGIRHRIRRRVCRRHCCWYEAA